MLASLKIPVIPLHLNVYTYILALCKKCYCTKNEVITMHLTRRLKAYQDFFENTILLLLYILCIKGKGIFAIYPNFTQSN